MPRRRFIDRSEEIRLDLRLGHIRRAAHALPRLRTNLRALGAVGPMCELLAPLRGEPS